MNPGAVTRAERTAPPGSAVASHTTTSHPASARMFAATSPLCPAPMTTASGAASDLSMRILRLEPTRAGVAGLVSAIRDPGSASTSAPDERRCCVRRLSSATRRASWEAAHRRAAEIPPRGLGLPGSNRSPPAAGCAEDRCPAAQRGAECAARRCRRDVAVAWKERWHVRPIHHDAGQPPSRRRPHRDRPRRGHAHAHATGWLRRCLTAGRPRYRPGHRHKRVGDRGGDARERRAGPGIAGTSRCAIRRHARGPGVGDLGPAPGAPDRRRRLRPGDLDPHRPHEPGRGHRRLPGESDALVGGDAGILQQQPPGRPAGRPVRQCGGVRQPRRDGAHPRPVHDPARRVHTADGHGDPRGRRVRPRPCPSAGTRDGLIACPARAGRYSTEWTGPRCQGAGMTTLDEVAALAADEHGLAVVSTLWADSTIQASVVNAGVLAHPLTGRQALAFVTYGRVKLANLRARPQVTVTFRHGWQWATVEGRAELAGPDDPQPWLADPDQLRLLLREVFTAAGGRHDDWEKYDRVMAEKRRTAVLIDPVRIYSNG